MTKTETEWAYIETLLRVRPDLGLSDVRKHERPDFLATKGRSTIGAELTELLVETRAKFSPLKVQESLRRRVMDIAERASVTSGMPQDASVLVSFNGHRPLTKSSVERVASSLSELVLQGVRQASPYFEEEFVWTNRNYFPEEIQRVRIFRDDRVITRTHWGQSDASWLVRLTFEEFQDFLLRKEGAVASYKKSCEECWLLVHTFGSGLSSAIELQEDAERRAYHTRFDRVFIARYASRVIELQVAGR